MIDPRLAQSIMDKKAHYDKEVFAKMLKLAFTMNEVNNRTLAQEKGLFELLEMSYPDKLPELPKVTEYPLEEIFLIGLIDSDGCFSIAFRSDKKVRVGFHITQHVSYFTLLERVKQLLGCGTINKKGKNVIRYQIDSLETITSVLKPFVDKYQLLTKKADHYDIFKKVCDLLKIKKQLPKTEFLNLIDLAYDMNKSGKRRKLTKEEYIKFYIDL